MKLSLTLALGLVLAAAAALAHLLGFQPAAIAAAPFAPTQILEMEDAALTSYLEDSATPVQGVRPRVGQRGVHLDGALRSTPLHPMSIAGNPFGTPVPAASVSGVRLSTGTYVVNDVDLALPAPLPWRIGRSYNARQDDDGSHFDSQTSYQGVNWFQSSQPEILLYEDPSDDDDDVLYLVYSASGFAEYARVDGDGH